MAINERWISKSATNGYSVGNDSNNGQSFRNPYLTVAAAMVEAKAGGGQWLFHMNDGTWTGTELEAGGGITFGTNPISWEIAPENEWTGARGTRLLPTSINGIIRYTSATIAAGTYLKLGPVCLGMDEGAVGAAIDPSYLLWFLDNFSNQFEVQLSGTTLINPLFYGMYTSAYKLTARNIKWIVNRDNGGRSLVSSTVSSSAQDWDIDGCAIDNLFVKASGHGGIILDASTSGAKAKIKNVSGRLAVSPTATGTGNVTYGVVLINIDDAKIQNVTLSTKSDLAGWAPYGLMIGCNDATLTAHRGLIEGFDVSIDSVASGVPVCIGRDSAGTEQRTKASNCRILKGRVVGSARSIESGVHGPAIFYQDSGKIEGVESSYVNLGILMKMSTGSLASGCLTHHIAVNSGNAGTHRRLKGATNCDFRNCTAVASLGYTAPFDYIDFDTVGPTQSTGGSTKYCSNVQLADGSQMNNKVVYVSPSGTHTFDKNNYDVPSIAASNAFTYQASNYNTLAAWVAAQEATGTNVGAVGNRLSDIDFHLPAGSALATTGVNWWSTGHRPIGPDGEPLPDLRISIGCYQQGNVPMLPRTI